MPRAAEAEAVEAAAEVVQGAVVQGAVLALLVPVLSKDFEAPVVTPRSFAPCVVLLDDQYAHPC